ncbi:MAG: FHA domain-containing protein, partial [Dehalococcoidia bacterium]
GSDPACEVPLEPDGESVAAAHAQLWFADGRFIIRSMSPQHPTLVAGQTVNWAVLDDGDEIAIGQCRIRFEAAAPEDNPPDYLKTEQLPTGSELLERHD